jgi:hypothetical protein
MSDTGAILIEPDYRGSRIQARAELVDGAWDATVQIRRVISEDRPHVERVTCRKMTAEAAVTEGAMWGRRWVDLNGS